MQWVVQRPSRGTGHFTGHYAVGISDLVQAALETFSRMVLMVFVWHLVVGNRLVKG